MAKTEAELAREALAAQDALNKKKAADADAARLKEQQDAVALALRNMNPSGAPTITPEEPVLPSVNVTPSPKTDKTDWQKICDAYKKQFPDNPEPDQKGSLAFATQADAVDFFEQQAREGRAFLASESVDGKRTGFHVFSSGHKDFHKGSYKEIRDAIKNDPVALQNFDSFVTPAMIDAEQTQLLKNTLSTVSSAEESPAPAPAPNEPAPEESHTPKR